MDHSDPRLQPGAYIAENNKQPNRQLWEVLRADGVNVSLENCATGQIRSAYKSSVLNSFDLVRATPAAPDSLLDEPVAA